MTRQEFKQLKIGDKLILNHKQNYQEFLNTTCIPDRDLKFEITEIRRNGAIFKNGYSIHIDWAKFFLKVK